MLTLDQVQTLQGNTVRAADGDRLGRIDDVYVDPADDHLTFATVSMGIFGTKMSFVPLEGAEFTDGDVVVPFDSNTVKSAPNIDEDAELSPEDEERLYAHYGLVPAHAAGHDISGPDTEHAMTRSEEQLQVSTHRAEAGRVRLRKYVTSETETLHLPVTKERAVVEREPITEANVDQALDGPRLSEEEHEVVLTAERPVVTKATVPVERVRVETEGVNEEVAVSEDVRKEEIEVDVTGSAR